jgi:hypothetical protein
MEPYEFDELDEPSAHEARNPSPADTRQVRYGECDVCGRRVFCEDHEEPPRMCPPCDDKVAATVADLVLNTHARRRERDDD